MAIEQTIQSMYSNLSAAYDKIAEKGGDTPENKNMQNLPAAIKTVKSGGGDGTTWGTLYTTTYPEGKELTQSDYLALGNGNTQANLALSFGTISRTTITKFSFGSACTFTPNYFLYMASNLTELKNTEVLQEIGNAFCSGCSSLNSALHLPNASKISYNFLMGCAAFDSPLELGDKLETIGDHFMYQCIAFAQPLTIPSSVESIDVNFLQDLASFLGPLVVNTTTVPSNRTDADRKDSLSVSTSNLAPYQQGVTINGSAALAWKSALPNHSESRYYRKLNYTTPQTTFAELKAALNSGQNLPAIGAEIPDTYDGQSNPLIVAQYLDSSNNSSYGGAEGCILIRKWLDSEQYPAVTITGYAESGLLTKLNSVYLEKCSDELKQYLSDIEVPVPGSGASKAIGKWNIPSALELYGNNESNGGIPFDYWKYKTGLSSPSVAANNGRKAYLVNSHNHNRDWWIRPGSNNYVTDGGAIAVYSGSNSYVLPFCFIAKD